MPLPDTPYPLSTDAWAFITSSNYADMRSKLLNSGTLATDAPITISQTWNNAAVPFTAFKVNAAGTSGANSASGSLLVDFQLEGARKFSVRKDGLVYVGGTLVVPNGMNITSQETGANQTASFTTDGIRIPSHAVLGFTSVNTGFGSFDTILLRDAANTLALRNAGAPQTFNVYGTSGTNNTDYRRLGLYCPTTGEATIQSQFSTPLAVTGGNAPSTTATIFFTAQASAFPVGSTVVVSGVTPSGYNGPYTVTASTTTSVSYTVAAALANWSSGGTAVVSGVAGTVSINGVPVGLGKGNVVTNVAVGTNALNAVTTGSQNTVIGYESSIALTSGNGNTSIGFRSLRANTGSQNVSIGADSLQQNSSGSNNTSLGYSALNANTTGASNTAVGAAAMLPLNSGSNNTALGNDAGRYDQYGVVWNQVCNQSVFLGAGSKAQSLSQTNQIVIGYNAIGIGDNSVVLGNDSITKTALKGNVGIGTTNPVADLDIAETWNAPAIAVTSATGTGTVATVNFAVQATAIPVGTTVLITGVTPTGYNGSYVVTVSTTSSVSYANATTTSATAGGTVQRQFTTVKVSSVDTNSAPTSNLLELWSGAVTPTLKTSVTKYGTLIAGESGATKSPAVAFPTAGSYSVGIYSPAPYVIQFAMSSVNGLNDTSAYNGMQFDMTTTTLSWGASVSQDIKLVRENANQLALRNGETNQMFRVYATYSNSSNYRRCAFGSFNGTDFDIQTEGLGTGAAGGALNFGTAGVRRLTITTAGNVGLGTSTPTANLQITQPTAGIGTISVGAAGATVTGVGTQFLNTFKVGDTITSAGQTLTISAIASDTSMTISPAAGAAISGQVYTLVGGTRMSVLGNGNVGIGANNPTAPLQIYKDSIADTTAAGINLLRRDFGGGDLRGAAIYSRYITDAIADCLVFGVTGSSGTGKNPYSSFDQARMVITETGRVGIGTTAPGSALHISGALGSNTTTYDSAAALKLTNTTGNTSWLLTSGVIGVVNASFSIRQESSSLPALVISNLGNVGIGTTAPSEKLDVAGNVQIAATSPYISLKSSVTGTHYIQSNTNVIGTGSGNYLGYLSPVGRGHTWCEGTTSRMMIEPTTGNVGIGTTSPTSKLHVAGTIKPEQATITTNANAAFTLDISHAGTVLTTSHATGVTITLPTAGTVGVGYNVMIIQGGAGPILVQAGAGNTLNSFGSLYSSAGLHAAICIVCTAANTYNISGNLA